MPSVLRTYDLNPDGIRIAVEWGMFEIGTSFFIPCINTAKAVEQVKVITKDMGMQVRHQARAENGRWGVRIWRTL